MWKVNRTKDQLSDLSFLSGYLKMAVKLKQAETTESYYGTGRQKDSCCRR